MRRVSLFAALVLLFASPRWVLHQLQLGARVFDSACSLPLPSAGVHDGMCVLGPCCTFRFVAGVRLQRTAGLETQQHLGMQQSQQSVGALLADTAEASTLLAQKQKIQALQRVSGKTWMECIPATRELFSPFCAGALVFFLLACADLACACCHLVRKKKISEKSIDKAQHDYADSQRQYEAVEGDLQEQVRRYKHQLSRLHLFQSKRTQSFVVSFRSRSLARTGGEKDPLLFLPCSSFGDSFCFFSLFPD